MKGTLNRLDNGYMLLVDGIIYATDNDKLSKENCDSLFGVVDAVKLGCDIFGIDPDAYNHINTKANEKNASPCVPLNEGGCVGAALYFQVNGFIKAMELNSDKLFTEFDIIKAFEYGWNQRHFDKTDENELREIQKRFIQSLQQPTEIEVRIAMGCSLPNGCTEPDVECTCEPIYNLDENGCLTLWVLNT
jgi:hypothetical protein